MLLLGAAMGSVAQDATPLQVTVSPQALIPLSDSTELFGIGGGGKLGAVLSGRNAPLYLKGGVGYNMVPTQSADTSLSFMTGEIGGGLRLDGGQVELDFGLFGGGYLGFYDGSAAGNPLAGAESTARFRFSESFSLEAGASYNYLLTSDSDGVRPFYTGIGAFVGATIAPGARADAGGTHRPQIRIEPPQFDRVFPVFYQYYNDNPLGSVSIENGERDAIRNVKVSFFVNQYMDAPKVSRVIPELARGESESVDLLALFQERVLEITEETSVSAQIGVVYELAGEIVSASESFTLRLQNRNEMTWEDDRRAASFVTPRDPNVLRFARNVTAAVRNVGSSAVNERLRTAMAVYQALSIHGVNYVVDPDSAYIELSDATDALDYLQFPSQTLDYRAGDCDDLSILFAALLESIGTRSAFVTIPGHIFTAFALDMDLQEAQRTFGNMDDLIVVDNEVWVPVELTVLEQDFLRAWSIGAKQWREAAAANVAGFFPLEEAWTVYTPTGFRSESGSVAPPESTAVVAAYQTVFTNFVQREIAPQVNDLESRIVQSGNSPRLINRLGTLYARYGLYDKAEEHFLAAVRQEAGFLPALINLGHLYFLRADLTGALEYYEQAFGARPDDPNILISLARTHFEREEYNPATERYRAAEVLSPELASQYSYIVSENVDTARASAAQSRSAVEWSDF